MNKVHDSDDIDAEIKRPKTFIEKFKKIDSGFNSKIDLVNFLLLSHNNTYIHEKVTDQLNKDGSVDLFDNFLKKYFFTQSK